MLSFTRIETLSTLPLVDTDAVVNFLATLDGLTQAEALANLEMDSRLSGWNVATNRAIQLGIMEARLG